MSKTQELPLRKEVPEELTWDLTTIYSSDEGFEADFAEVQAGSKSLPSWPERLKRMLNLF